MITLSSVRLERGHAVFVSEVDHRRALALVGDVAQTKSLPEFLGLLLPGLQRTVGADEVTYSELTTATWRVGPTFGYPTTPERSPEAASVWSARPTGHPWVRFALRRDHRGAVRLSDLCSRSTLQRLPYYADFYRPRGVYHADYTTIAAADGVLILVGLNRAGRDFSDREHDVVEHLRRPLGGLWTSVRRTETGHPVGRTERTSSAVVLASLTPAEQRVADLVARGRSNTEVATALAVSRKAVEQHLTRIYRRLGVRSRSQLVRVLLTPDVPS